MKKKVEKIGLGSCNLDYGNENLNFKNLWESKTIVVCSQNLKGHNILYKNQFIYLFFLLLHFATVGPLQQKVLLLGGLTSTQGCSSFGPWTWWTFRNISETYLQNMKLFINKQVNIKMKHPWAYSWKCCCLIIKIMANYCTLNNKLHFFGYDMKMLFLLCLKLCLWYKQGKGESEVALVWSRLLPSEVTKERCAKRSHRELVLF